MPREAVATALPARTIAYGRKALGKAAPLGVAVSAQMGARPLGPINLATRRELGEPSYCS